MVCASCFGWAFVPTAHERFDPIWRDVRPVGSVWESQRVPVAPAREAILSWNVRPEAQTGLAFEIAGQVRGRWSGWTRVGEWGDAPAPILADPVITRSVDVATWDAHVDELRVRVRTTTGGHLHLDRLVLALPPASPAQSAALPLSFTQDVPFRSQRVEDDVNSHRLCGATCLAMALSTRVPGIATSSLAQAAYDPLHDIYGNWARLAAVASQHGLVAWPQRLFALDEVFARIAAGYMVICSIAYEAGELVGAPIERSSGHLVIVRGWNGSGEVVCNDPAFPDAQGDGVTYRRSEFERLWLGHGGATILVRWPA